MKDKCMNMVSLGIPLRSSLPFACLSCLQLAVALLALCSYIITLRVVRV